MERMPIIHEGVECYVIDGTLISDGTKTMRVAIEGRKYFLPKAHAKIFSPGRFAIKCEMYDILFDQDKFKKTIMVKATFLRNMGKVPVPKLRRFTKN